jgi:hypothetical protein
MGRGRASFDSVIAATAGFTTAEVRQALVSLASSTLQLITPDLWAKQLQGTQRPGGTLQPFKFDLSPAQLEVVPSWMRPYEQNLCPADRERLKKRKQQAQLEWERKQAVRTADQELALQPTSTPSPALHSQTPPEAPTTPLQVDPGVLTPHTPSDLALQATAADYLQDRSPTPLALIDYW